MRVQLIDYNSSLDPTFERLKFSVYTGVLASSIQKIGIHIFNIMKIKKISTTLNYKDWETAEKHQNLIF